MQQANAPLLIIEDSNDDFLIIQGAFYELALGMPLIHCVTGDEALDYLYGRKFSSGATEKRPKLILLDLHLPGKTDGREVLKKIKSDSQLRKIPVVILSGSSDIDDINYCYDHGASAYVEKPIELERFKEVVQKLATFWCLTVTLP